MKDHIFVRTMRSDIQRPFIGIENSFVHRFRERGMREYGAHQFLFRSLEIRRYLITMDQFGYPGADDVRRGAARSYC